MMSFDIKITLIQIIIIIINLYAIPAVCWYPHFILLNDLSFVSVIIVIYIYT